MNKEGIKSVVISVFFSELTALLFLVIMAFISYSKEDPAKYSSLFGIAGLLLGALACGIISTIATKRKSLTLPLISGLFFYALQIICTLLWSENSFDFISVIVKLILSMGICFLSSYLLIEKKSKNKHRRKH